MNARRSWTRLGAPQGLTSCILVRGRRRYGLRVDVLVDVSSGRCAIRLDHSRGRPFFVELPDVDAGDVDADERAADAIRAVQFVVFGPRERDDDIEPDPQWRRAEPHERPFVPFDRLPLGRR